MMSDSMIREGFLCPICMQDLGSVVDLQQHFDVAHAGEDKAVLNQLKDFFGKAKQKILNNVKKEKESDDVSSAFSGEGSVLVSDSGAVHVGGIDPALWEPQELGATRSYTDGFKRYRDSRMDRFVVETNKLVIRLDKLLSAEAPTDANKRKAFEKAVVPWAADSDVNLCTACGKSFSITRRRHHCRLCGGIICNRCSQFLPFSYAKKLTNPAYQYDGGGFRRSSSSSSLNSILSPEGEPHIRTCQSCRVLLERRDQQIEQRNTKPFIVQLYQKMQSYMDEVNQIVPKFLEMAESICSGETTYNVKETVSYRQQLVKLFENIDLLSKRIYTLGTNDVEDPPTPTALRLQKMVRSHATNFLQSNMMGLQALPSEEELQKLRDRKREEAQQKIDAERAEKERSQMDSSEQRRPRAVAKKSPEKKDTVSPTSIGWIPAEINTGNCDDPMIQQMNIIRGYLKQAKQLNKHDEVKMLEENLRDLQLEYWTQQEQQKQQRGPQVGAHGSTAATVQQTRPVPNQGWPRTGNDRSLPNSPTHQTRPATMARNDHVAQNQHTHQVRSPSHSVRSQSASLRMPANPVQQMGVSTVANSGVQSRQRLAAEYARSTEQPQPYTQPSNSYTSKATRSSEQPQPYTQQSNSYTTKATRSSSTSPRKTPPKGSPSKTSPTKTVAKNPFDDDEPSPFDEDDTNPFSDNYKEPSHPVPKNPFS